MCKLMQVCQTQVWRQECPRDLQVFVFAGLLLECAGGIKQLRERRMLALEAAEGCVMLATCVKGLKNVQW